MVDKYILISRTLFTLMWIQLCWGFVCTDIVPVLDPTRNIINLLADVMYLFMGLITLRSRSDLKVLISFMVIAGISAYLNHQGVLEFTNGFRSFIGLLMIPPILRYLLTSPESDRFVKSMDRQLYIFLWIQVPCIVSQFIRYGACDAGGGSLGYGSSGTISIMIYVISFYLMNKRWNSSLTYVQNLWENKVLIFLLFPTFLNETKISFIFFLAYFVLLLRIDRRFVLRMVISAPLMLVLGLGIGYAYLSATNSDMDMYDADFFYDYLIGLDLDDYIELSQLIQEDDIETDNLWAMDLPRFGRFLAVPDALDHTGGGMLFGAGIGQFKGGSIVSLSRFARDYQWLLRGSAIMTFFIIIELGIAGFVWLWYSLSRLILTPDAHQHRNNMLCYLFLMVFMVMIYNDIFRLVYFCLPIFYTFMRGLQGKWSAEDDREEPDFRSVKMSLRG